MVFTPFFSRPDSISGSPYSSANASTTHAAPTYAISSDAILPRYISYELLVEFSILLLVSFLTMNGL